MTEAPNGIDGPRLIAALRADDTETIRAAYVQTFGGRVGQLVLVHALQEAGVGALRNRDMGGEARAYQDGCADAVLKIANMAGFDAASVVLSVATGDLEGPSDERHEQRSGGPGTEPGDDGF